MDPVDTELSRAEARVRAALADPEAAQTELLREILAVNRDTAAGARWGFGSIPDLRTYRARVPLATYADVAPDVDRMIAGAQDVLFAGPATFFGCTSGTTAAPKRVGFNPRVRAEYIHMLGPMVAGLERDFPGASRATLLLTAQYDEGRTPTGVPMGNASGFVRRALDEHPYFRLAPEAVYESRDADARSYALLLLALGRPMRCFASLFPVLLVSLFRRATELAEALADDLARGGLAAGPPGARALAPELGPRLRPLPAVAARLRASVRAHGRFLPAEHWPDVCALHVWKGGTAKPALGELRELFPRAELRPMSSGSTEASLMVPLDGGWTGGVPALRSTVMDFLPAGAPLEPSAVVTLRDLEPGQGYRLVVTNHRGLYRYVMEDVFSIEGYCEGVPILQLEHRVGIVSSVAGEKLTEAQALHAVERATAAAGVPLAAFELAPEPLPGTGAAYRYALIAEIAADAAARVDRAALAALGAAVEADLYAHNSQYALNRNLGALGPVAVYRVRPGHFEAVLRARSAARGRADVQYKVVALRTAVLDPSGPEIAGAIDAIVAG